MKVYSLLLLLIFVIIISCSNPQNTKKTLFDFKNDQESHNLNGKVKSFKEISNYETIQYIFNEKGNVTEKLELTPDDSIKTRWVFRFDSTQHQIKRTMYDSDGTIIIGAVSEYGPDSKKIKELFFFEDTTKFDITVMFSYIDNSELIKEKRNFNGDSLYRIESYEYNTKKNYTIVKYSIKDITPEKEYYLKWEYKYDSNSDIIEKSELSGDGKRYYKDSYKYDKNRNMIEETYECPEDPAVRITYKYEFDEKNNWIKKFHYRYGEDEVRQTTKREIEYW